MKVDITNDMWEHTEVWARGGRASPLRARWDLQQPHVSLRVQVYMLMVKSTTSLDYVSFEMNTTSKMDTNINFLLTEGGAVHVHGCK